VIVYADGWTSAAGALIALEISTESFYMHCSKYVAMHNFIRQANDSSGVEAAMARAQTNQSKKSGSTPGKPISVRIKFYPPTVEEAVAAARDLTDDLDGQAEIASGLMGIAPDDVRDEVHRIDAEFKRAQERIRAGAQVMIRDRSGGSRAVVVERSGRPGRVTANKPVVVERTNRFSGLVNRSAPRAGVRTFDLTRRPTR